MAGKVLHRLGEHRLVALGHGDQRAWVVGNDELRHAAIERQGLRRGAQLVDSRLRGRGKAEAVARYAHGGDKDVGASLPPGH